MDTRVDWDQLSLEAQNEIMGAATAYHTLKHERLDYQHWVKVGLGLKRLRDEAVRLSGMEEHNNPVKTPQYRAAYRVLISNESAGELAEIQSGPATHAVWVVEHKEAVDEWFAQLPKGKALEYNHPTTIWRHHPLGRKLEQSDRKRDGAKRSQSVMDRIDGATGVLAEAAESFEARRSGFLDFAAHFEDSIELMIELYGAALALDIGQALVARLAQRDELPAKDDPAFAASLKAKPPRKRGVKALDDPARPRNRGNARTPAQIRPTHLG